VAKWDENLQLADVFNVNIEAERKKKRANKDNLAEKLEEFPQHLWDLVDED
jgi:hypothetical protein